MQEQYLMAIDQGTTSSRVMLFNRGGECVQVAQQEFAQYFPEDGWVEHDASEIWQQCLRLCQQVLKQANITAAQIAGISITNQRETTVLWDKATGEPLANAIVWQDRRTARWCDELKQQGHEPMVQARTGLLLDPYFSATKLAWLLDHVPQARERAEAGELAFGTMDTWLLWQLTQGQVHATDATNASRTLLFNIHEQRWDQALLELFNIPACLLPQVHDSAHEFGHTAAEFLGAAVPILGIAGDQQAALIGQACFEPGMVKSTYGTGCFMILNTGKVAVTSANRLLTTVAYRLNGEVTYGLEGSIFVAGAALPRLRDGLKLISHASENEELDRKGAGSRGGDFVPAFTRLGAPWWGPPAPGALLGVKRDTGIAEVVTAGLEAVCYQTLDLLEAMVADGAQRPTVLRVDGGMVVNNWLSQRLADILGATVARPQVTETTALGAAYLAGLQAGWFKNTAEIAAHWRSEKEFTGALPETERLAQHQGWRDAVLCVRSSANNAS